MQDRKTKFENFNKSLNEVPFEELVSRSKLENEKNEREFEDLKNALVRDHCSYCGNPLSHFSERKPCFHWFLWRAKGLKKKHFGKLFGTKGYHQLEAYLRWVANTDVPITNINDIAAEKSSTKFIETTIRYRNLEWSFSCSHGDLEGHKNSHEGSVPHYHFQMKKDGNVVINFNGFHIPFNDYDEFCFAIQEGRIDRLRAGRSHGAGMQDLLDNFSTEELADNLKYTNDEKNAQFETSILIEAEPGTTISGDDIANLLEERKRTGDSMAKLAKKLKGTKTKIIISPGKGVPDISTRDKNRG